MAQKRNIVESAMRNNNLVFFFMAVIVIFGFIALPRLKKNEFPDVTIRTGVVAVVYPGATAEEVEQRVAGVTEQYLFTFADVDKNKTYSYSKDGMLIIMVNLVTDVKDAKMTWSRIRQGLQLFRQTSLPKGVLTTAVIDDFGNASSLLLAIESDQRSSRELREFADKLSEKLRTIKTMGNIKIVGEQKEEIAVYMDPARMTQYAVSPGMVTTELAAHSLRTITGTVENQDGLALIHVEVPIDNMYELGEIVVFSDQITGQMVKLRDVARLERRYKEDSQYIQYSDSIVDNNRCLMFSMEMRPGYNVVAFGEEVNKKIDAFLATAPPDIKVHRITDQPVVVNKSVMSFLKDLIEAIIIVIIVMLMLFPLRTALVSSTSVPVCIAAAWAIMYLLGMELNTVTLAALIVVLGMIVDDSVVVIDGYSDMLAEGHSRWYSAAVSTKQLMTSMLIATCSISCMFFPMLAIMNGTNMGDFIKLFPWAIFITLACSFLYAIWVIPFMSARMIGPSNPNKRSRFEKIQAKFFDLLQNGYKRLLNLCFRHKWATVFVALLSVVVGMFFMTKINIQMLPKAERDSFAVEIHLANGSSLEQTAAVADSLTKILKADKRVKSVTAFLGMASPRFHMTYAPEATPTNAYAQFIVITESDKATKEMMNEYPQKYENYFPIAQIRFKQMDYQIVNAPVEYYIKGDDYDELSVVNDSIEAFMKRSPNLFYVHSDFDDTEKVIQVNLDIDEASRLGVTQSVLSVYLAGSLTGSSVVAFWDGSYNLATTVYTENVHDIDYEGLGDILIPTAKPGEWVPLRQVATLVPQFKHNNLPHRNGMKCVTVAADVIPGAGQLKEFSKIDEYIATLDIPDDIIIEKGGSMAVTKETMPSLLMSIMAAVVVMFIVLIIHYQKIGISFLSLSVSVLCIFGSMLGLWLFGLDLSVTAMLGVISLIGIIVRNAIIMYDYAAELREKEHVSVHQAAYDAGLRRMRPIFLTSATTALGVIPMILAKTLLWEPMGVVICFGTILTFPLVVTVLPVAYCLAFDAGERDKKVWNRINLRFLKNLDKRDRRNERRNMKKYVIIAVLALSTFGLSAQNADVLTLDSCFTLAKANNAQFKTSKLKIEQAQQVKKQVFTKYFPQVTANYLGYYAINPLIQYGVDEFPSDEFGQILKAIIEDLQSVGVPIPSEISFLKKGQSVSGTLVQPIFAGGRIITGNKLAKLGIEAAELQAEVTERDVLESIESTYYLVLGLQAKVATLETALALIDSLDHTVDVALKAGLVTKNDQLRVALKRNELNALQLQLNNGIMLASQLLCQEIGIEYPEGGLNLQNDLEDKDIFVENTDFIRPEIQLLQLQIDAEVYYKRMARGEALPEIGVGAMLTYGNMIQRFYKGNGIFFARVAVPITQWWETSHKIKQHNLKIEEYEIMQQDLTEKMSLQEKQAYNQMVEAEALLESDKASLDMAKDNYHTAEVNYRAGMNTITDVLEANALLLQAQNAITDREISYVTARRRYHDLTGK